MTRPLSHAQWQAVHQKTLETFNGKELVVSYSGGKDSSLLLDYLLRSRADFGYHLHAHGVAFPSHVFLQKDQDRLGQYWEQRGLPIVWHGPGDVTDTDLSRMVEEGQSPCVVCSRVKKERLLAHFKTGFKSEFKTQFKTNFKTNFEIGELPWDSLVMVIGYTLWDLASACVEHTLRTCFGDKGQGRFQGRKPEERFLEISQRFYPLLKIDKGPAIFKPLIRYNDPDIARTVADKQIPITTEACQFKFYRPKRHLSEYYGMFGLNFTYEDVYAFARKNFDIPDIEHFQQMELTHYVNQMI